MSEQRMAAAAVVVGVDGSGIALSAVRWAAREAQRRGAPLRIVHVASYAERSAAGERRAASILTLAHTTAEKTGGHVAVTTEAVPGDAASALAEAAADAQLLVVGMGGGERYEDIRLHSTTLAVCTATACPVAVVRGVAGAVPEDGQVVLGIEDVTADAAPVTVAFGHAQRHDAGLVVVHALHGTGPVRDHVLGHEALARRRQAAWTAITDGLAPWRVPVPGRPGGDPDRRRARARPPAAGRRRRAADRARHPGPPLRDRAGRPRVDEPHGPAARTLPGPRGEAGHPADRAGRRGRRGDRRPDPARTRGASRDAERWTLYVPDHRPRR